jgi:hypothetical protein
MTNKINYKTWFQNVLVNAQDLNDQIKNNGNALWVGEAQGDLDYYDSAIHKSRMIIGDSGRPIKARDSAVSYEQYQAIEYQYGDIDASISGFWWYPCSIPVGYAGYYRLDGSSSEQTWHPTSLSKTMDTTSSPSNRTGFPYDRGLDWIVSVSWTLKNSGNAGWVSVAMDGIGTGYGLYSARNVYMNGVDDFQGNLSYPLNCSVPRQLWIHVDSEIWGVPLTLSNLCVSAFRIEKN